MSEAQSLDRSRFRDLLPDEALVGKRAVIVGVGGIGGYVAPLLAKMGMPKLRLVDPDRVEEANVATQAHGSSKIGWDKVAAVEAAILEINEECAVEALSERFQAEHVDECDIVVTALDSLSVRLDVVRAVLTRNGPCPKERLLVDPRMGLESLEVNVWPLPLQPRALPAFSGFVESLSDTDALELPCGAKAVAYTGSFAAAVTCAMVRRWLCGESVPYLVMGDVGTGGLEAYSFGKDAS